MQEVPIHSVAQLACGRSSREEGQSIDALSVRQSSVQRRLSPKEYYDVLFACDLAVLSRTCIPPGLV